ncbi:molybdopterin-dependent oxidoreductase [Enterobacter cloacae subsp. cloacae]|nr:molybdopterin-dependent oxidoreductase [Enterobacter cloacae subsp. cloacae]
MRAAYIMGEDPLQTDAELSAVRPKGFEDLELVIVQDIFMTKTAAAADVILPSTSSGASMKGFTRRQTVASSASLKRWSRSGSENRLANHQRNCHPCMGYPMHYKQHSRRSGTSCGICVRTSTVQPMKNG